MIPKISSYTGIEMPAMLYGTAWKEEKTSHWVKTALLSGFPGVDTACQPKHYNEPGVGEGLKEAYAQGIKREDLFLQTKFTGLQGQDPNNVPYDPKAPVKEQVKQSVEVSLKNLGTDQLDSLVLHGPLGDWNLTLQAWKAIEEAHKEGKVRQIGVSNFYNPGMLKAFVDESEIKPATIQNRFYKDENYDVIVRELCKEYGMIYQCFWTLTANPHILQSSVVSQISKTHGKTPAQIFFRFIHQLGIQILTGTTSPEHMKQDLEIFNFELSDSEFSEIKALGPF